MTHPFEAIVRVQKSISTFAGWSAPVKDDCYCRFEAALEFEGVTERGIFLHGGFYQNHPNKHVTFELRVGKEFGHRSLALMRLDWRSLHGGHSNPRKGPSVWAGRRVSNTHLHDFDLNWLSDEGRLRANDLRIAREIEQDLQSFEEVRDYVGKAFRVNGIELVTLPEWQYSLL